MVSTIVKSIEFTFRKYEKIIMAIWHIATYFVVEGHMSICLTTGRLRLAGCWWVYNSELMPYEHLFD